MVAPATVRGSTSDAERLVELVRAMLEELRGAPPPRVSLDFNHSLSAHPPVTSYSAGLQRQTRSRARSLRSSGRALISVNIASELLATMTLEAG